MAPTGTDHRLTALIASLHELSVQVAVGAGEVARAGRARGFEVGTKSTDTDLVTGVDRAVEGWLAAAIHQARPNDGLLAEEGAARTGTSGVRWVIDPIDGTVNFALGLPHYAVSVAAELDGTVVAGCVHNPESAETYSAARGAGALLAQPGRPSRALSGPRSVELARSVVGTGFGYAAEQRARQGEFVSRLLPRIGDIRRLGAASLDLCAVASGRLDAYFEVGLNHWDYAAGLLIATEAGCIASGPAGHEPGSRLIVVSGAGLAEPFAELLTELGIDAVST
jgi:myo-inositol-1(or 4)-monophosphatase